MACGCGPRRCLSLDVSSCFKNQVVLAAKSHGLRKVVVQSDNQQLTKLLRALPRSAVGSLLALVIDLGYDLDMCRWEFIRRSANHAAAWLCRWTLSEPFPLSS